MIWGDFFVIVLTVWGLVFGITGITYVAARFYAKVKENQFGQIDDSDFGVAVDRRHESNRRRGG